MPLITSKTPERRARNRQRHHHFLVAWIRSPLKVGALIPSSRALGRAMANQLDQDKPGVIIELGAGTGAITHALLEAGVHPDKLIVVERDPRLHAILSNEFRDLNIVCGDAVHLENLLREHKISHVNAIVSSLPLLSMPKKARHDIENSMINAAGKDGMIVQFTYGGRSPLQRGSHGKHHLEGKRVKMILGNVPPAHVWVYKQAA